MNVKESNMMRFLKNNRGQGTTEYIIILAVVVLLAYLIANGIKGPVTTKINAVTGSLT